jgi:hypothetical protein
MKRFGITKLTIWTGFALLAASMMNVVGQEKTVRTYGGSQTSVVIFNYTEIPEATEECTAEEKQWWDSFRNAGNDLQRKVDQKSEKKFRVLLAEGLGKGYRIPLKDRPPQVLVNGRAGMPELIGIRPRNTNLKGNIELSIEYRADGSIGDIKIVKGLGIEIDGRIVQGARRNIFVPAIKDGVFVTTWQSGSYKFSTQPK